MRVAAPRLIRRACTVASLAAVGNIQKVNCKVN